MSRLGSRILTASLTPTLAAALIFAWEVLSTPRSAFFFSRPVDIAQALTAAIARGQAQEDLIASFSATVLGLALGTLIGGGLGLAVLALPLVSGVVRTFIGLLAALPILAIAPMFLIWFGTGLSLKVAIAALLVALIMAHETIRFPASVDPALVEMSRANHFTRSAFIRTVLAPSGVGRVFDRFPDAANAAFLGVFVGEFVAADRGIGYRILRSGSLYQVDAVLANALLAIVLLGVLQLIAYSLRLTLVRTVQRGSIHPVVARMANTSQT